MNFPHSGIFLHFLMHNFLVGFVFNLSCHAFPKKLFKNSQILNSRIDIPEKPLPYGSRKTFRTTSLD